MNIYRTSIDVDFIIIPRTVAKAFMCLFRCFNMTDPAMAMAGVHSQELHAQAVMRQA